MAHSSAPKRFGMENDMQLVYGIDICQDVTQISTIRQAGKEPEELFFDINTQEKLLPTVLYLGNDEKWYICEEAYAKAKAEQGAVLKNFFGQVFSEKEIIYQGSVYSSVFLLECYVVELIKRLEEIARGERPQHIVITCQELNQDEIAVQKFKHVLEAAGLAEFCEVRSHLESFVSYMVHQGEALWKNGAAAFEYGTSGIFFYYINTCFGRDKKQLIADYAKYTDLLFVGLPPTEPEEAKKAAFSFGQQAGLWMNRRQAVSLFITGRGFNGNFAMEQIQAVSTNRRLFKGQNLYTQGACYMAYESIKGRTALLPKVYMPMQIVTDITLKIEQDGKEEGLILATAGESYPDIKRSFDVIVKGEPEFCFAIKRVGLEPYHIMLGLPVKEKQIQINRYQVRLFFLHRDRCVLQIKDMGFGMFQPTTYRIYEKILDLSKLERKTIIWEA